MDETPVINEDMTLILRHQAILTVVGMLIFFTNLGNYALFNDDEAKNGTCGAEMYRRGDLLVPTFNEELRTDKPILTYWFMLTSFKLFGVSEFSARLASSILAVGTILLTYHLGRKLYTAEIGFLAGLILATCLLFSVVGRAATPDSALIFFVTLSFASYVWVVARRRGGNFSEGDFLPVETTPSDPEPVESVPEKTNQEGTTTPDVETNPLSPGMLVPANWKFAAPAFAAMGLAVLAKGPVGLVLPCVIILPFLLITRRERDLESETIKPAEGRWWRRWFLTVAQVFRPQAVVEAIRGMHLLIGLGIVAAIALPWYLAVGVKTNGEWLRGFFLEHNVQRALFARENHTGFPFYQLYQLVSLHLGCFPWSIFLPVALYQMWQRFEDIARWRDSDRLLACWSAIWFILFSVVSTRLPNYLLPMYPAIALILARYFYDWERDEVDSGVYEFNLCCRALWISGAVMVVGAYIAAFLYAADDQWFGLIGAIPVAGALMASRFLDQEKRARVIQTLLVTSFLLAFVIVGIASARIIRYQDSPKFIADAKRYSKGEDFVIGTYRYFRPTVAFYAEKKVTVLQSSRQVADFLSSHPHAFVITPANKHNELREDLRGDVSELSRHRDFLHRDELILLGRY
jgi:4-amino-4-deoxy-L-arabinose transferase-like glycosyltransferase